MPSSINPTEQTELQQIAKFSSIISRSGSNDNAEYEKMIQKYEADIRDHIRTEQQMKLYLETLQETIQGHDKHTQALKHKFAQQIDVSH